LIDESNPEEDLKINRKIIDVLKTEIRRLSGKDWPTDKSSHSTAARSRSNTKPSKTVFTSTQTEDGRNKKDASTGSNEQTPTDGKCFFAADHTSVTQENPQNMSMSIDETPTVELSGIFTKPFRLVRLC